MPALNIVFEFYSLLADPHLVFQEYFVAQESTVITSVSIRLERRYENGLLSNDLNGIPLVNAPSSRLDELSKAHELLNRIELIVAH